MRVLQTGKGFCFREAITQELASFKEVYFKPVCTASVVAQSITTHTDKYYAEMLHCICKYCR